MAQATWNDTVLAESDSYEEVEGNIYFPKESLNKQHFTESDKQTTCPWKGQAHYYDVTVDGKVNTNAAWYYPNPKKEAQHIKEHVAFWKGVNVEK